MDTVYCSHRCLLWTLLIILLNQCLEVSGSGRECPQGQLLHHRSPYSYCCYPTRCGVGHQVRPCSINGTHDTCQMCPPYQNQSLRTSSFTMDQCTYWPLDKECKSVDTRQRDTSDVRTRRCMCNIELGFRFIPPESESPWAPMDSYCQRRHLICKPGHEPVVNGDYCQPCQANYFKSSAGHTLCEPKTNCHMLGLNYVYTSNGSTADNNCSEPDPVTTPKPYIPETEPVTATQKPSPVVTTVSSMAASTSTQDTGHYDSSRDLGKSDNSFAWPLVGVVLFLVMLILFIGLVMFWRKRKGKSVWVCATSKNCTDPEKNYPQGSGSLQGDPRSKHNLGGGCVIPQHLTEGDKVTNNNVNGGLPCHMTYLPNGHPNGNIRHAHFSPPEHGNGDARSYCVSPLQYHLIPTSRPGILRGSNHNVVFGQTQGSVRDRSIDSIGQEKLQVHVDELEANQNGGENDPLLVPDHLHGAAPCHIQNLGAALGHSPPVVQAGVNPLHLLAYSGPGPARATFGPTFVHSGASSQHVPPQGPVVTCAPATGAATFTRSTSVIASPEGEVDEDEIEARLPRLSQLLTEGENSTAAQSDQSAHGFFRADSPGRETTQQLRAPSQRLKDQFQPPKNGNPMHQQPHPQGIYSAHQRPGFPPAVVGPVLQRGGAQLNQPDHRIMNLKEQQLAESFNSTSNNPATNGQQVKEHDLSATDSPKTVVSPEESQQTEVKTQLHPAVDSDFFTGMHLKTPKVGPDTGLATEPKQVDTGRAGENFVDRKRHVSGGGNSAHVNVAAHVQNSSDRMRVPSSGSNSSSQSTLERQRVPSGDQQRPCIKNSSPEEGDNNPAKRQQQRYNRTVSFEEEDSPQPGNNRQHGPSTESRSSAKSGNSPEKATNECRNRGPLRSVSDPEQKNTADTDSDCEETERKCVSLEYNASNGSSKCSVNSDYSEPDSNGGSPCRTALYRRSHSENASSGSDSAHKPPPRSMSEEKPQKLDRPIAKVKPMPASDNAVNQLPCEASDDAGTTSPLPVAAVAPNNNAVAFDPTSDESEHEDNPGSNNTTREEHDAIRESEEEDGL